MMPGDQHFDLDPHPRAIMLDDERHVWQITWVPLPHDQDWITVRSYDAFVAEITSNGLPDFITFDHDLGIESYIRATGDQASHAAFHASADREMTGYDAALWLIDYCTNHALPLPECQVHSMNPIGRANIWAVLQAARDRGL